MYKNKISKLIIKKLLLFYLSFFPLQLLGILRGLHKISVRDVKIIFKDFNDPMQAWSRRNQTVS